MAIAFGRSAPVSGTGASPINVALVINAGETVVAHATLNPTSLGVTSFIDTAVGGSTYIKRGEQLQATSIKCEGWSTAAGAALAATNLRMAFTGTNSDSGIIGGAYTGVLAIGNFTTASGSGANPSITLATQDANGWVVAGFALLNGGAVTAGTGNLRQTDADVSIQQALVDNTSASAGNVTCSLTLAAGAWAAWALELRPVLGNTSFYLNNPIQSGVNTGLLDTVAPTASTSTTGWTVGATAVNQYSRQTYNTEIGTAGFTATAQPSGAPVNLGEDCYRISAVTSGTFSADTWYSNVSVIAVTSGGIQQGRARTRIWRSANADGTSATEVTQGTMIGSQITELNTTVAQSSSASTFVSALTLTSEFLFHQIAWETL